MFFSDLTLKPSKYTKIKHHSIMLNNGQQSYYESIYSLRLVELRF